MSTHARTSARETTRHGAFLARARLSTPFSPHVRGARTALRSVRLAAPIALGRLARARRDAASRAARSRAREGRAAETPPPPARPERPRAQRPAAVNRAARRRPHALRAPTRARLFSRAPAPGLRPPPRRSRRRPPLRSPDPRTDRRRARRATGRKPPRAPPRALTVAPPQPPPTLARAVILPIFLPSPPAPSPPFPPKNAFFLAFPRIDIIIYFSPRTSRLRRVVIRHPTGTRIRV